MKLNQGVEQLVGAGENRSGTHQHQYTIETGTTLVSVVVTAITGVISVSVYTEVGNLPSLVYEFDPISLPTPEAIQWLSEIMNSTVRIQVDITGTASYQIFGRAIPSAAAGGGIGGIQRLVEIDMPTINPLFEYDDVEGQVSPLGERV